MPQVFNKHHKNAPAGAVYVGRPTPYGNPFSHTPQGTLAQFIVSTRDEAVARYEQWLRAQPDLVAKVRRELVGKDLVCWCAPHSCHADVLVRVANEHVLTPEQPRVTTAPPPPFATLEPRPPQPTRPPRIGGR